jgi:NAD(P)-dependent dehydrogenase (short-subunit alcohol dehydrogenase family)
VPTVLITGSARRIGAGVARALAADGWRVLIHYHHSAEAAAELATGIQAQGGASAEW